MTVRRNSRRFKTAFKLLLAGDFEVSWQRLQAVELVIWDEVGSQFLLDALDPVSHYILKVRNYSIYLHPLIVWETLISALTRRNTHYGIVIKHLQPKAVVTFIDNNAQFHKLASRFPDVRFIAIQNGARKALGDAPAPIGPPASYDSEYLCFGQNEIDSYRAIGYHFKQIKVMGSLKNALFVQHLRGSTEQFDASEGYDLVLISQFRAAMMTSVPLRQGPVEYEKTVRCLYSYLESHAGLRVSVAMVTAGGDPDHDAEVLFHQERLGNLVTLVPNSEDRMSNYYLTEKSKVAVSAYSTLGLENLGRGCRTLMCSSIYSEAFKDQPFFPDWALLRLDQETFDDAMTKLLVMPREDFVSRNSKSKNYVMVSSHENSILEFKRQVVG